ncbi:SAM-dependent methyltransferase [Streptomyces sp. WI04-05B]|uniref:SAM-dependent methyltransferase n=1 Tax=Streptomyces TaxID=1883 RepID=UPI0029B503D9|nr:MULTISPECIES: SAM-dependent methyltransferase [unclassified Streptomyces]MDX2545372.1 SAM-dependent methyltransferase [Streptomyces sp. WI04-05B]MDX2588133.1 SAM-dependent methyltransferase [Streptomyces sp. WI04-05A]
MSGGPAGVGRTALGAAMIRAVESRRPDRLFHDPYAAHFLTAAPEVFRTPGQGPAGGRGGPRGAVAGLGGLSGAAAGFWAQVVLRTRFFDDHLLAATAHGVRQVVLLAAGLDTRAYRLAWPDGVSVFELDLPGVLDFKRRVLAPRAAEPRGDLRAIPADLREDWPTPLAEAGFRAEEPTAWLLEGLLIYLSANEVTRLLTTIGELSAPGSHIAFEYDDTHPEVLRDRAARLPAVAEHARLWQGGLPDAPARLAADGWRCARHALVPLAARLGRPLDAASSPGGFLTAVRGPDPRRGR